jgi:hypothetical protein
MGLRAGDACPWCGESLSAPESPVGPEKVQGTGDNLTRTQAGRSALLCRECGCEIGWADDVAESAQTRFNRAA